MAELDKLELEEMDLDSRIDKLVDTLGKKLSIFIHKRDKRLFRKRYGDKS